MSWRRAALPLAAMASLLVTPLGRACAADKPQVDSFYDAPGGMFFLVVGEGDPGRDVGAPQVLAFHDQGDVLVRLYANHPMTLEEGRAALAKSRKVRRKVEAVRHRLASDGR